MWHDPATSGKGVSADGHKFDCEHLVANSHVMFLVDVSGSMQSGDCKPTLSWIQVLFVLVFLLVFEIKSITHILTMFYKITKKSVHNNRIGAAYQAVQAFIESRMRKAKDKTTVILYDDRAAVYCHKVDMDINLVRNKLLTAKRPGSGGTNFETVFSLLFPLFVC